MLRTDRRRTSSSVGWLPFVALALTLVPLSAHAQESYASGQNVVPVYEGWEQNPDGSFNLVFGYFNRNYRRLIRRGTQPF